MYVLHSTLTSLSRANAQVPYSRVRNGEEIRGTNIKTISDLTYYMPSRYITMTFLISIKVRRRHTFAFRPFVK